MGDFLAGPIGSAVRVFVGSVLGAVTAYFANGGTFVGLSFGDVQLWLGAAIAVALPIVVAALNPADTRFGRTG